MPSKPNLQACSKTVAPSPSVCSLKTGSRASQQTLQLRLALAERQRTRLCRVTCRDGRRRGGWGPGGDAAVALAELRDNMTDLHQSRQKSLNRFGSPCWVPCPHRRLEDAAASSPISHWITQFSGHPVDRGFVGVGR